jgi:hypothetical protein
MEKPDRPERGAQKIFNIVNPPSNTKKARRITLREYLPLLLGVVVAAAFVAIIVAIIVSANSLPGDWLWAH